MKQVIIIGGGASGLMAGIMAARGGASVTILEKCEKPGKKILATGNGRCNLTNNYQELSCYHGDKAFIENILQQFSAEDTKDFFRELGLFLKERDGWIYPRTDQAQSVLQLLLMEFARLKGKLKTKEEAVEIKKDASTGRFTVLTKGWHYEADAVIVSSGTPASNIEGVSEDALRFAGSFGMKTKEFRPSLVPLKCVRENYFAKWAGIRAQAELKLLCESEYDSKQVEKNKKLNSSNKATSFSVERGEQQIQVERGEVQLTDYGISGIPVFQLSSKVGELLSQGKKPVIEINFFPDDSFESLLEECRKISERASGLRTTGSSTAGSSTSSLRTADILAGLLPDKLISAFCGKKSTLEQVLEKAFCCRVKVSSLGAFRQAQICAGGVRLSELTNSMESKKVPGLYFTGECCDTDGRCGGYNLQWAWSTGAVAGRNI